MKLIEPWVGANYSHSNIFGEKRVMILGESYYGFHNMKKTRSETFKLVVQLNLDTLKNHGVVRNQYFRTLAKICLNKKDVSYKDYEGFWQSIIFYNYVNQNMKTVFQRPNQLDWENSFEKFLEVLNIHKPEYILVCGKALWFGIPEKYGTSGPEDYTWYFDYEGGKAVSTYIYHPSRYPNGKDERVSSEIFKKLLKYKIPQLQSVSL
ncbi:MAG: hypothetical protein AUK34_01940 [Ignavibacteria bacterium CG2_30_36_16]|nr:hypothetical protein [Ignavibacteria bacterium]OIP63238.1 MAG: hypothetical protein AUK34_01940 [Ignavibacteria bacterium CG2_30_36_16]PJA99999.1 MAG: hypothetical protein CO127_09455 [Ignavibacteria bacterium CG_4_9_14_3_um_filter_36_18]